VLRVGGPVVALSMIVSACGGGGPAGPSATYPALTSITESAHYVIHSAPGDTVDTVWQDQYHEWLVTALQLQPSPRLDYFKYRDRAHIEALTGKATNGFAEPGTTRFHTIWPIDNHECVHAIVILQVGHPPALFNEGIAVAHQTDPVRGILTPRWNGTDLHALARTYDASGRLPVLSALERSSDFFKVDTEVTYPCAGSFVRWLIDTYGLAPLKRYISSATFDDAASTTENRFQLAYGRSLASAWAEWRVAIRE